MYFYLYDNKDFKIFIEKQMYTLPFKFTARVRCPVFITGNHDQVEQDEEYGTHPSSKSFDHFGQRRVKFRYIIIIIYEVPTKRYSASNNGGPS